MRAPGTTALLAALVTALLLACGCGSFRPAQVLDAAELSEVEAVRDSVEGGTIWVLAGAEARASAPRTVATALSKAGFSTSHDDEPIVGPVAATIVVDGPFGESPVLPWLTTLSLGVIPTWSNGRWYRLSTVDESGEETSAVCAFGTTTVYGWLACLVLPMAGEYAWVLKIPGNPSEAVNGRVALGTARFLSSFEAGE